jgi:pimeloyl-ACP methyl ester carboxylesterase
MLLGALAVTVTAVASTHRHPAHTAVASRAAGRLIILPGIHNTRFHLVGFARRASQLLPSMDVEIRTWGPPLLGLYNLRARERNRKTADALAAEITAWRRTHPEELLYIVGYSGGGGIAALAIESLPDDVRIDRLILVAPAISADYDFATSLLPHVKDYVVNFSSEKDLQVGLGTRWFGTIDGIKSPSAGFAGFTADDERIVEWHWSSVDRRLGHRGNHVSYLGRRWQEQVLLPALDSRNNASALRAAWRAARERDADS